MTDFAALAGLLAAGSQMGRIHGVVTGIVTNNQDPDGLGRVRVRFGWLSDQDESRWARIATPMAGKSFGAYFLPEVDDEVLVAFDHGDMDYPYVLGVLWNGKAKPPESNSDGQNDVRTLKSRSGHIIRLDDKDGAEKIEIIDKSGKNTIVISTARDTITIKAQADIVIESSGGKLTLSGQGVEIKSQAGVKIEAASSLDLKASGQMTIKGAIVNIN